MRAKRSQYGNRFYAAQATGSAQSAEAVAPILVDLLKPSSVVDVGCGVGTWLAAFKDLGVEEVLGVDGDWVTSENLRLGSDEFMAANLSGNLLELADSIDRRFDLAMSVEVAEHLPKSSAADFVRLLTKLSDVVIFSAAVPDQGGTGHINEQWPQYWCELFANEQYVAFDMLRPIIWNSSNVNSWYKQNIVAFFRSGPPQAVRSRVEEVACENLRTPLDLVHPGLFRAKATNDLPKLGKRAVKRLLGQR